MAFLTIAGIDVDMTDFSANEPEEVGESHRAFSGALRTTVRAEKRAWTGTTVPLDDTAAGALIAAVAGGAFVTVTGAALQAASVTCKVTVTGQQYRIVDMGFLRVLSLSLTEV